MTSVSNRIGWSIVRLVFAVLALLVLVLFNVFVNVSAQNLVVSVLWTVLVALAIGIAYVKLVKGNKNGYLFGVVVLVVAIFALIVATGASASTSSTASQATVGDTGGINWDSKPLTGGGCHNAQVWHTGNYPVGGFTNYHAGVRIRYCLSTQFFARFDSSRFAVNPYVEDTEFVDGRDSYVTSVKKVFYTCTTWGKLTWHGCAYVKVNFAVPVDMPLKGQIKTATPWVEIWINGFDGPFKWDWSKGLM